LNQSQTPPAQKPRPEDPDPAPQTHGPGILSTSSLDWPQTIGQRINRNGTKPPDTQNACVSRDPITAAGSCVPERPVRKPTAVPIHNDKQPDPQDPKGRADPSSEFLTEESV